MVQIEFPKHGGDQIALMFPYHKNTHLTHDQLHVPILEIMDEVDIPLVATFCRTKTLARLREKFSKRGWDRPAPDIHAVRLVLRKTDFIQAKNAIFGKWPTPEFVYPRLESFRDYDDPKTRASYNTHSDRNYRATHLNIHVPFGARVAEVQLYTVADYVFYMSTKDDYLRRQRGL